ncbi:class I SAM-dependent methyltransferase [Streptomyces sp. CB02923]|uniref:class I SAM-dependent methyltransferase n=1 Tax=Streptomyces sp. CB02923 TaxID=1718985 RepID=UPI001F5B4857|nr:class I SAM-dependent methyltransferase [Streptomyces sp. CB02923]
MGDDASPERHRLESIQRSVDTFTTGVIDSLPVGPSWNCLELGAGAGSIAYWLAERCPDGWVTAVDIDTRHLDAGRVPNLYVQRADITHENFAPGAFDLIHARYLLCHLSVRDELMARAVRWLAPGGWLVVEEPYHLPAATSPFPVVQRVLDGYQRYCREQGADMTWARGLPALMARAGLSDVAYTGNLGCMGGLDKDRWFPLIAQAAPALLAGGLVSEADLVQFSEALKNPTFIDIPQITISAWGRRPKELAEVPTPSEPTPDRPGAPSRLTPDSAGGAA